jgi:hypothetical protein
MADGVDDVQGPDPIPGWDVFLSLSTGSHASDGINGFVGMWGMCKVKESHSGVVLNGCVRSAGINVDHSAISGDVGDVAGGVVAGDVDGERCGRCG